MKLIEQKCKNCGSMLKINSGDKEISCDFCGAKFVVDDEIQHIQYDNAEQAGYEFEKGRQRAQAEQEDSDFFVESTHQESKSIKNRRTWLWVLGWIFIFPLPLTILLIRNKKLNKWIKIGIIVLVWLTYLAIGSIGYKTKTDLAQPQEIDNIEDTTPTSSIISVLDSFVAQFNNNSDIQLVYVEDFSPQNRESGHYRTEFRLGAYKDSVGKSYHYNELTIDLIGMKELMGDTAIRLYLDGCSIDECSSVIASAALSFDSTLTETDINEIIDYISENKKANVYNKGNIDILLLGDDDKGYNLMIKNAND